MIANFTMGLNPTKICIQQFPRFIVACYSLNLELVYNILDFYLTCLFFIFEKDNK
jgi:hypothetical protein